MPRRSSGAREAVLNSVALLYLQKCMSFLSYEFAFHVKCVRVTLFAFCSL